MFGVGHVGLVPEIAKIHHWIFQGLMKASRPALVADPELIPRREIFVKVTLLDHRTRRTTGMSEE